MAPIVILTTMVRNERRALPRLLRSVVGICTHVALTDTGSTDDTIEVATATCRELGLVLDVRQHPWQDFGTCRTLNVQHGRDVAAAAAPAQTDAWLLLLDADMVIPAKTPPAEQLPPVGMLPQRAGASTWWNIRIVSAAIPARYLGRTHEYIDVCGAPVEKCAWFTIDDRNDGGCKADKYERDERLLRLDLAEKNDTRSRFYLAESLRAMGRLHEAKALYDERAKVEDHPEEAWMARHMAARCSEGAEADMRALNAFFTRPQRLEPLADVARRAADAGNHRMALGLVDLAGKRQLPAGESLWVDEATYRWGFDYVDMISSFYVGALDRGMAACERLRLTHGSPHGALALENARFYARPVPGERVPLPFTPPEGYVPLNPCIRAVAGGHLAIIRTVNYRIDDRGAYRTADGRYFTVETPVLTRNFVAFYPRLDGPPARVFELQAPPSPVASARVRGFEDLRIIGFNGFNLATVGVRLDANEAGVPEIWEMLWGHDGSLRSSRRLSQPGKCEKNWLPRPTGGYIYDAYTTVNADGEEPCRSTCPDDISGFRGSAAPIEFHGGALRVVHEVSTPGGGKRVYLHRFVWQGEKGQLAFSSPFLLAGDRPCIECCFGIAATASGDVIMSCSREDCEIYTIQVPGSWIRRGIDGFDTGWHESRLA